MCPKKGRITDVFNTVRHTIPINPAHKFIIEATDPNNIRAKKTAELLDKIFNYDGTGNSQESSITLRNKVYKTFNDFLSLVLVYIKQPDNSEKELKKIIEMIDIQNEFSVFMRWYIKDNSKLNDLLGNHIK